MDERLKAMTGEKKGTSATPEDKRHRELIAELRRQALTLESIAETTKAFFGLFRLLVVASAAAWLLSVALSVAAVMGWI